MSKVLSAPAEGTFPVNATAASPKIVVSADGKGLVSQAGAVLLARALRVELGELVGGAIAPERPARAEKLWFRLCDRLRERDEAFLRGVEHLVRALDASRSS